MGCGEAVNAWDFDSHIHWFKSNQPSYAVCPGGEEAVLKIVDPKGFVGSNPMHGVVALWSKGYLIRLLI